MTTSGRTTSVRTTSGRTTSGRTTGLTTSGRTTSLVCNKQTTSRNIAFPNIFPNRSHATYSIGRNRSHCATYSGPLVGRILYMPKPFSRGHDLCFKLLHVLDLENVKSVLFNVVFEHRFHFCFSKPRSENVFHLPET